MNKLIRRRQLSQLIMARALEEKVTDYDTIYGWVKPPEVVTA